jgi:hypothetical protein
MKRMSALGQKRTFAVQNIMSALPPKADICSALGHVRFVPITDMRRFEPQNRRSPSLAARASRAIALKRTQPLFRLVFVQVLGGRTACAVSGLV